MNSLSMECALSEFMSFYVYVHEFLGFYLRVHAWA